MSLDGTYDPENVFAKILAGDMPCHKVYEDDAALAFMDLFPQSPGHVLILPKAAARNILDVPDDALQALIVRVKKVAAAVKAALAPDGMTVIQFNGAPAGQTVFHLHFHVIPRYEGRELAGHGRAGKADDAELAAQAEKIAAALGS